MRLIPNAELETGMILGRTIYSNNGVILLNRGVRLTTDLIRSINKNVESGRVYIDDELSKGIEAEDIIDEKLRNSVTSKLRNILVDVQSNAQYNPQIKPQDMVALNESLASIANQIISNRGMLVDLVDLKSYDDYTFQHSTNVSVLSAIIGVELGFSKKSLHNLLVGALFHDIGKMFVPLEILNKQGIYTPEEFEIMKAHPKLGFDFLRNQLSLSSEINIGILSHHEKYNGTGYPMTKVGEEIHINARIIAICDVFDAMTSKRTYHEPILPSHALEYIISGAGSHFDFSLVQIFLNKIAPYPLGSMVELSNGHIGLVCENRRGLTLRPKIRFDTTPFSFLDLAEPQNFNVTIVRVVDA